MPGLAGPAGRFTDRSGVGSVVLGRRRYVDIEPEKVGRRTASEFRKFRTVSGLPCRVVAARRPVRPVTLAPIRRAGWSEAARQRSPEDVGHPTAARSGPVDLPAEQCLEVDACLGGSPVRVHVVANVYARSRYAGSVSTRMMSSATASTCHRAAGSHSASPRACSRRALSGRSAPCASTTCGVPDAIAAARRPSRPAPIAKTARVAAAGRRCSRCTQPCRFVRSRSWVGWCQPVGRQRAPWPPDPPSSPTFPPSGRRACLGRPCSWPCELGRSGDPRLALLSPADFTAVRLRRWVGIQRASACGRHKRWAAVSRAPPMGHRPGVGIAGVRRLGTPCAVGSMIVSTACSRQVGAAKWWDWIVQSRWSALNRGG